MRGRTEPSPYAHTLVVHPRQPFPTDAVALADSQDGVLTRAQLVAAGLRDSQIARLCRQELLTRLDRGVYCLGRRTPTWRQYAWAAVLLGGPGARLCSRSAAALEGLWAEELPIELGIPRPDAGLRPRPWLRVLREHPGVRPAVWVGAPARTPVATTVLDLTATLTHAADVVAVVTTATQRLLQPRRLRDALEQRARHPHRALLRDLVAETTLGVRSPLEWRFLRSVERPHRLPAPVRQYRLSRDHVADGAWPEWRVLLELDGQAHHDGSARFRDWRRDNRASEEDWLTLRFGWSDVVTDACGCAANVARVLQRRGWAGSLRSCARCPALSGR
jgi:very-short-patch-repair endonuclease